ncbi:MAG: cupin-like domain-containing protein [Pseudomonadota bacterium]
MLDKLLAQREDARPMGIYAGASPTVNTLPRFAELNQMPLVEGESIPKVWVGNSARIAPHFDISENIACNVSGVHRFVIFPPDQIENLYVGPIDYNMAGQPASMVDLLNIDLARFPKFETATQNARIVELHPGDASYLPSLWWHFVDSSGPLNVLVNCWFDELKNGSPMNVLALALLVFRDLPENDRAARRSVFDHYFFGENASGTIDHIPEAFRGVLASSSPQRDHRIKAFLTAQLPRVLR